MEPIPLPDVTRKLAAQRGFKAVIIGPPEGASILDDDCPKPVEALVNAADGSIHFNLLISISDQDMILLQGNGGRFWLTVHANQLPPFSLSVFIPDDEEEGEPDDQLYR